MATAGFTAGHTDLSKESPEMQNFFGSTTGWIATVIIEVFDDDGKLVRRANRHTLFVFDTPEEAIEEAKEKAEELLQIAFQRGLAEPLPNITSVNNN